MEFFCLKLSNGFHCIQSKSQIPAAHKALQHLVPTSYPYNLIAQHFPISHYPQTSQLSFCLMLPARDFAIALDSSSQFQMTSFFIQGLGQTSPLVRAFAYHIIFLQISLPYLILLTLVIILRNNFENIYVCIFVYFLSSVGFAYVLFEGKRQEDRGHIFHIYSYNSIVQNTSWQSRYLIVVS